MKRFCASLIVAFFLFPLSAAAGGVPWGEPNNTSGRFIVLSSYNNEAVYDSETGLAWQQSPLSAATSGNKLDNGRRSWVGAQFVCNEGIEGKFGNRAGWRIPTIQELASLLDRTQANPALPALHPFTEVQLFTYWSATTTSFDANRAWTVRFTDGFVAHRAKSDFIDIFVWCVRGGQGADPQ